MTWWLPLLAFIGALVGAGVPASVSLRGQRQDARGEWRQRLDLAIDLVTSEAMAQRRIGEELLVELINSDLGSDSDRGLAERIAQLQVSELD